MKAKHIYNYLNKSIKPTALLPALLVSFALVLNSICIDINGKSVFSAAATAAVSAGQDVFSVSAGINKAADVISALWSKKTSFSLTAQSKNFPAKESMPKPVPINNGKTSFSAVQGVLTLCSLKTSQITGAQLFNNLQSFGPSPGLNPGLSQGHSPGHSPGRSSPSTFMLMYFFLMLIFFSSSRKVFAGIFLPFLHATPAYPLLSRCFLFAKRPFLLSLQVLLCCFQLPHYARLMSLKVFQASNFRCLSENEIFASFLKLPKKLLSECASSGSFFAYFLNVCKK